MSEAAGVQPYTQMRICFVGDSFVNGAGDPDCLGWTGRVCAAPLRQGHDITQYNLGVRHDTSVDLMRRWGEEVGHRLHGVNDGRVVFSFGVNDTDFELGHRRVELAHSLANARAILLTALQHHPTLMVGPPPVADAEHNQRTGELSQALASVCEELGVAYLETCAPLCASRAWMRDVAVGDGAHPGASGYAALADLVCGWSGWRAWF